LTSAKEKFLFQKISWIEKSRKRENFKEKGKKLKEIGKIFSI
jgi:hypothetical protein